MVTKVACIGSGNMGTALMRGLARAKCGAQIGFADPDCAKARAAADSAGGGQVYASNAEAAADADCVFLAVKPQKMAGVLEEIGPALRGRPEGRGRPAVVSMAAGWSAARIGEGLSRPGPGGTGEGGPPAWIVRIMPNTPALVSRGVIPMAVPPGMPAEEAARLAAMLGGAGRVDAVDEALLDAATGLSGSGPAYAYMFIEALADGGVLAGLPRDKALAYAAETVLGAAAMVLETGMHPGALKDMVCSPGGTTIAGVKALESGAFRASVIGAVEASWRKSLGTP